METAYRGKIASAKRLLGVTVRMVRDNYGPKPSLMRWAYQGIVRPALTYGCVVWGHKARKWEDRLRKLNRLAMSCFTKVPKSTPTRAMEITFGVKPLHLHIIETGIRTFVRLNKYLRSEWDNVEGDNAVKNQGHVKHWEKTLEEIDLGSLDYDIVHEGRVEHRYNVNLPS